MKTKETSKPNVLYNKEWNDYAYWNGTQYVGKISGANFYTLEKASNNGYLPITSTRELAMQWWNSLSETAKIHKQMLHKKGVTGREIEQIWIKETQINQDAVEMIQSMKDNIDIIDQNIIKPNQKQDSFTKERNALKRIANASGLKPNQKQFKQFDESLFQSYIDKFSDEDKVKAIEIIKLSLQSKTKP